LRTFARRDIPAVTRGHVSLPRQIPSRHGFEGRFVELNGFHHLQPLPGFLAARFLLLQEGNHRLAADPDGIIPLHAAETPKRIDPSPEPKMATSRKGGF
jgi:hypothetical protein